MEKIYEYFAEFLSKFILEHFGFNFSQKLIFISIVLIVTLFYYVLKNVTSHIKKINVQFKSKSLHPYFNSIEIFNAQKNYIVQNFQNVAPSKEDELIYTHSSVAKQKIIKFFMKSFSDKSDKRFFIILADSGMGKTTFSLNLYQQYNSYFRFFLLKNKYEIALIPLGYDDADQHIKKMKEDKVHLKSILILDAFDEDSEAIRDPNNRLRKLIDITKEFRFVIITCRTQFFNNENLEPGDTNIPRLGSKKGFYFFDKLYLSPFTDKDVKKYIDKKYGYLNIFSNEKKKAKEIIAKSPYLMARPMLLDFIEDIASDGRNYEFTFTIYESLINSWLDRETSNISQNKKYTYKNDLLKFSSEIAKEIYRKRMNVGYTISQIEFEKVAKKNNLDLMLFEMKARSLLNRNPEGDYKFSHKSILEYFLSLEIYRDLDYKKIFEEEGMDMTITFYDELCYINDYENYCSSGKLSKNIKIFQDDKKIENISSKDQMLSVTKLEIENFRKNDLRVVRGFKNLTSLLIKNSSDLSLDDINCFKNLVKLTILNSTLVNLRRIGELSTLFELVIKDANLFDYQFNEIDWLKLQNLNTLDVSQNKLVDVSNYSKLKNLQRVNFSDNSIYNFTISPNLYSLDLSHNKINIVEISRISLREINLSFNDIKTFTLLNNQHLVKINLSNNRIADMSFHEENVVEYLCLSDNSLEDDILNKVLDCRKLKKLYINNNRFTSIPQIRNLDKLELLDISNTQIHQLALTDFPTSMTEVYVSNYDIDDKIKTVFQFSEDGRSLKKNFKKQFTSST